eukprot:1136447-Pelagomonas_calceolata.AAC.4
MSGICFQLPIIVARAKFYVVGKSYFRAQSQAPHEFLTRLHSKYSATQILRLAQRLANQLSRTSGKGNQSNSGQSNLHVPLKIGVICCSSSVLGLLLSLQHLGMQLKEASICVHY